jgi:hypothetical protein
VPPRWDRLPPKAKEKTKRKSPDRSGRWRCRVDGCGAVVEGADAAIDRHLDTHGGGRADCIIEFKEELVSVCSSCGAQIEWVTTTNGKRMPIDADPSPGGNLVMTGQNRRGAPEVAYLRRGDPELPIGTSRWVSHFATCPNSKEHRR